MSLTPSRALSLLSYADKSHKPTHEAVSIAPVSATHAALCACDGQVHTRLTVEWSDAPCVLVRGQDLARAVKGLLAWPVVTVRGGDALCLYINGAALRVLVGEEALCAPVLSSTRTMCRLSSGMVARCLPATDKDRSSAVLAGVYVGKTEDACTVCAATDGKILMHAGPVAASEQVAILPHAFAQAVSRYGGRGALCKDSTCTLAEWGSIDGEFTVTGRTVDGSFPRYVPALLKEMSATLLPGVSNLLAAVAAAAQGLRTNIYGTRAVIVSPTGAGPLNTDNGGRRVSCDTGVPVTVCFNADYCAVLQKACPSRYCLGRGLVAQGDGWTALVMRITLPEDCVADFSDGAPLVVSRARPPVRKTVVSKSSRAVVDGELIDYAAEIARLRALLDSHGIAY